MKRGIDISKWQKGLLMDKVKDSGYDFVIIRGGYTSNGTNRVKYVDPSFSTFYVNAKACDLGVGVYYYSCAKNTSEGESEARFLYESVLKGRQFEYPIYIDVEDKHILSSGKKNATDAIVAFCRYLEGKGYYAGFYTGNYIYKYQLQPERLTPFTFWLAWWRQTKPSTDYKFHMWQWSSVGRIDGQTVDRDKCYVDNFPDIMKKNHLNGF